MAPTACKRLDQAKNFVMGQRGPLSHAVWSPQYAAVHHGTPSAMQMRARWVADRQAIVCRSLQPPKVYIGSARCESAEKGVSIRKNQNSMPTLTLCWVRTPSQISLAPLDPCVGRDTPVESFRLAVDNSRMSPIEMIAPNSWKKAVGIPPGKIGTKNSARSEAIRRWPAKAALFARVKDDGRAEACLIGVAGMSRDERDDEHR